MDFELSTHLILLFGLLSFFVKAGLGETMTEDDIQKGRLKVIVGIAAVRPAEFIILNFTFKVKEN